MQGCQWNWKYRSSVFANCHQRKTILKFHRTFLTSLYWTTTIGSLWSNFKPKLKLYWIVLMENETLIKLYTLYLFEMEINYRSTGACIWFTLNSYSDFRPIYNCAFVKLIYDVNGNTKNVYNCLRNFHNCFLNMHNQSFPLITNNNRISKRNG